MNRFSKQFKSITLAFIFFLFLFSATTVLAAPHLGLNIVSVRRLDPNPPNAEVVRYSVTFSAPVIDVDLGDFNLKVTGVISGVTLSGISGSGNTRKIFVNTGSGNGTIRLNVIDNDTIEDLKGNYFDGYYFKGEQYILE